MELPRWPVQVLVNWASAAQQQACRNAMVASTALAKKRAERLGVEEFLARRLRKPADEAVAGPDAAHG